MEPSWEVEEKVYINGISHMTKMAAMLIYGKNVQKSNRPRYQVSVYRTIGPLVEFCTLQFCKCDISLKVYLRPKVTLHCLFIYLFRIIVSDI